MPIRDHEGNEVDLMLKYTEGSSNVRWVGYPASGEPMMVVEFLHGGRYAYLGVSRQMTIAVARSVQASRAKSVGTFIHNRIKPRYKAVKLA